MSTPRIITAGETSSVTLSFTDLQSDAVVTVDLQDTKGTSLGRTAQVITAQNAAVIESIDFLIPRNLKHQARLRIISTGGASFNKTLKVEVRSPEDKIFIQTDKPIYKPGGKGQFLF